MRKLQNPFVRLKGYQCFGCSPDNPHGLRLQFVEDGEWITSSWEPVDYFQGWMDTLHGGIQATLMDEIASWCVFAKLDTSGVTCEMEVKLKKQLKTNEGTIFLKARIREMRRNIAVIDTYLYNNKMELCTEGVMHYYTFPPKIASEKLWYPGRDAFFSSDEDNATGSKDAGAVTRDFDIDKQQL